MLQSIDKDNASKPNAAEKGIQNDANLEDQIFLAVDKLHALCSAQSQIDSNDCVLSPQARNHYSIIIEDQVTELRELLNKHFD
ncbi:hypothetical protein NBRC116493_22890 [Aurantivibrio infirmus]